MITPRPAPSTPSRIALANLPSPLEACPALGEPAGIDLWIKRDDLTGCVLSGNKVRKLEWLLGEARDLGADHVITCGATTSNHARATAFAAARLGLRAHLVLRGRARQALQGNLLLDRLAGAHVTRISRTAWRDVEGLMQGVADDVRSQGGTPYVVPEGGSNAVGSLGYVRAAEEIAEQAAARGLDLRRVVHATGSGGTTAGLAWGFAALGMPQVEVLGVAVCRDAPWFDRIIARILDEGVARGLLTAEVRARARWRVLEGWAGEGYAQTTPEEMADHARVARRSGLVVDPVYSGKALRALLRGAEAGTLETDGCTVFLHTGGIFGLFGFAREVAALSDPA